jgi:hypothetical protein
VETFGALAAAGRIRASAAATIPDLGFWRPATRKAIQIANSLYWL